jgi:hypothetical protein
MCCECTPKSVTTVFLDEGIRVVCGECLRDKKIEFCDNVYNIHENDRVSVENIGGACYCQECFSHERTNVLKASRTSSKLVLNKVVSYL